MDKKIISICFLLIIVTAATVTYVVSNQLSPVENQHDYVPADGDVTDELFLFYQAIYPVFSLFFLDSTPWIIE